MAVQSKIPIFYVPLDGAGHESGSAVGGALYYNFGKYMNLGMGWNAYPGTQSLQGSHPYWESYDRVMADEFFRNPCFSRKVCFTRGAPSKASVQMDVRKQQQQPGRGGG